MREIVLDTETTGLDPLRGDRLVEVGCVEIFNRMPTGQTFHRYINPERDMPQEAFAVHGLSAEFLADKPLFTHVVDEFLEFIGDAPLVIHNASFDISFINAELDRLKRPAIGRDRQSIYLSSLAVARPVTGRIASEDAGALADLARHHVALVRPKRLLVMGDAANRALLETNAAMSGPKLHVVKHDFGQTEALATFHPRFLLDNPARKARAWRDLQMLIGGIEA